MCEDKETQDADTRARKREKNNVFWMCVKMPLCGRECAGEAVSCWCVARKIGNMIETLVVVRACEK